MCVGVRFVCTFVRACSSSLCLPLEAGYIELGSFHIEVKLFFGELPYVFFYFAKSIKGRSDNSISH